LRSFRRCLSPVGELNKNKSLVKEYKSEFKEEFRRTRELKESSRYKKSVEAKTSGIGHGSREVGRKTSSWRVKIECALRGI
jgi:hypothetical protein